MLRTIRIMLVGLCAALAVVSVAHAGPQNMVHGQPAFDSGWRPTSGALLRVPHGLTGPVEVFVLDVQLREPLGEASAGVTVNGIGGDRYGDAPAEDMGSGVHLIDETDVWITTGASADTTQARVRIWTVPNPDYDSGWVALDPDEIEELVHGLGGESDDYVVDLTMRTGSSIHQRTVGGDNYPDPNPALVGAYWFNLNGSTVKVKRMEHDEDCPEVRVRIFVRPNPDFDSGWQTLSAGAGMELEHNLGGPWNDLYVDMQLRSSAFGIHNHYVGGDRFGTSSPLWIGASWWGLTGSKVQAWRFPQDVFCEQFRIRVWASRRAAYDSGWSSVATGTHIQLDHQLGGDPDAYVVDLQFNDADDSIGAGINTYKYGGDQMYDFGTQTYNERGAAWHGLDGESIKVSRFANDLSADQARVRIWQGSPPDWDSGWTEIAQGETLSLDHALGDSPASLVVDLQFRTSIGSGVNHFAYGGDQWYDTGPDAYAFHGAYWRDLTHTSIDVRRHQRDLYAQEVRLRIWKTTAFDAVHTDLDANPGDTTWVHGLDVDPEDMVVYLYAGGVSQTFGNHQYQFGGDRVYFGGWVRYGAWWENLGSTSLTLWRALDDNESNDFFVRLWWTGSAERIFADGFESGDLGAWTGR